ncbi:dUTP diphosphatase [Paenibacillus polymyxa]|uniref:dUTP diphosphatase n=1 Tax=Paenibacillus TaxID=44249 RepID=UPI00142DD1AE|nr:MULTISPECIES: deoxyuridine 5'-triphosphate nucleotidohydrolase [Paenibacillus]KAF6658899.1 deoxyuridine 5'-triphosphate nucleotidohydrolase [Paenibacillus sp. EKM301P]UBS85432.1 deoxyuridine 5'-triphosphate nucleotidohydrolase [Paenibacillus polymyxa]WHX33951.1 deoxyuridine 5'-triphosphate nucleotidohydrolase [Paenibacillus polymyxa]
MNVKIKCLHPDAVIPQYATPGAAAFDLVAVEDVIIAPGETKKVPLGLAFEIPEGYVMIVAMRSGVALKTKLRQPNGIGVIDSDYRGEVAMMFDNISPTNSGFVKPYLYGINGEVTEHLIAEPAPLFTYLIRKGDRVAQAFILPIPHVNLIETDEELSETERGTGGFGHTGVNP